MGNVTDTVNTSDTSLYRKRLYYYGSDKTLYSCEFKGWFKEPDRNSGQAVDWNTLKQLYINGTDITALF